MPGRRSLSSHFRVVLITASNAKEGQKIAMGLVRGRFAACVNVVPQVVSCYWWKGKVEKSSEVLLLVKTQKRRLPMLIRWVKSHHSYTVPEVVALPILSGNPDYLKWLDHSLGSVPPRRIGEPRQRSDGGKR